MEEISYDFAKIKNLLDKYKEKENNICFNKTEFNRKKDIMNFSSISIINDESGRSEIIEENKEVPKQSSHKLIDFNLLEKNNNFKINQLFNFINKWRYISKQINNKNNIKLSLDSYQLFIKNKMDIVMENLFNALKKDKMDFDIVYDKNINKDTIN